MPYTDNFRRQHDEILAIAGEIAARLQPDTLRADTRWVRSLLSALAGKLTIHLAMEDKALYPRLAEADVEDCAALALAFMKEMGGLGAAFAAYNQKWQAGAIGEDPARFILETREVFGALGKRIERENRQLYPMADRVLTRWVAAA